VSASINSVAVQVSNPASQGSVADNEMIAAFDAKPGNAGVVSETGMLKIDAQATQQPGGSDAVNTLVITGGTHADTVSLPGHHTVNAARHFSDNTREDGGGTTVHGSLVSSTGEDTALQSTPADNGSLTLTLSVNGSGSPFLPMTNLDHHASTGPEINSIANESLQHPADDLHPMPAQQPASFKFVDGDSAHPGTVSHDPPALTAPSSDLGGDLSDQPSKPNLDHYASADPEISKIAKDHLPHHSSNHSPDKPAQHGDKGSPAGGDEGHPAHRHFANFKFADDDSAHSGKVHPHTPTGLSSDLGGDHSGHSFKASSHHHASTDEIGDIAKGHLSQHSADNSPDMPAQHGSPAVSDGGHPAHHHFDNFNFADDDGAHSGKVPHNPPSLTAQSSDLGGDHSGHPFKTSSDHHAGADEIGDIAKGHLSQHSADNSPDNPAQHGSAAVTDGAHPANPHFDNFEFVDNFQFADDGSAHPGKVPHDPSAPTALSNDLGGDHSGHPFKASSDHHASADEVGDIAKGHLSQNSADNSPDMPAQHGSPAVTDGAHPANPHFDNFKFADDDSAHPGNGPHDAPPLTAPARAETFDLSDPAMAPASQQIGGDQFIFDKKFDHTPAADLKPDVPEIDHAKIAEFQHLLDIAQDTNAMSPADPHHGTDLQDMPKAPVTNQHDAIHLV
jgi:hypothetical protein